MGRADGGARLFEDFEVLVLAALDRKIGVCADSDKVECRSRHGVGASGLKEELVGS